MWDSAEKKATDTLNILKEAISIAQEYMIYGEFSAYRNKPSKEEEETIQKAESLLEDWGYDSNGGLVISPLEEKEDE